MLKLRQRVNGQPEQPKWEADDADDKLAERLAAEPPEFVPDDGIAVLPPQNASCVSDVKPSPREQLHAKVAAPKPQEPVQSAPGIDVGKLAIQMVELLTSDADCWIDGNTFVAEKKINGGKQKRTYRYTFSHISVKTVDLIS